MQVDKDKMCMDPLKDQAIHSFGTHGQPDSPLAMGTLQVCSCVGIPIQFKPTDREYLPGTYYEAEKGLGIYFLSAMFHLLYAAVGPVFPTCIWLLGYE